MDKHKVKQEVEQQTEPTELSKLETNLNSKIQIFLGAVFKYLKKIRDLLKVKKK